MSLLKSAIVFLGDRLSEDQFDDDELRNQALESGAHLIQEHIAGIRLTNRNNLFCQIMVEGTEEQMTQLRIFLEQEQFGTFFDHEGDVLIGAANPDQSSK
jgi:hypothetical protein